MAVVFLDVRSVRNIEQAALRPSPSLNLVHGPNGSGKTSLLEAICLLGLGRSFRTPNIAKVISADAEALTVFGELGHDGAHSRVGVRKDRAGGTRIKVDGEKVEGISEVAWKLPLSVLIPGGQALIEGGPSHRRAYIDWGMFHVEHGYRDLWRALGRATRQRNSALKGRMATPAVRAWDGRLSEFGQQVTAGRAAYCERLRGEIRTLWSRFGGVGLLDIEYRQGWRSGLSLAEALEASLARDREAGYTQPGPHRADLAVKVDGKEARDVLSRGQLKVLAAVMKLAQVRLLRATTGKKAVVLIDDLPSELDPGNRQNVLRLLREEGCQVFVTATEEGLVEVDWEGAAVFHVEHGQFRLA